MSEEAIDRAIASITDEDIERSLRILLRNGGYEVPDE